MREQQDGTGPSVCLCPRRVRCTSCCLNIDSSAKIVAPDVWFVRAVPHQVPVAQGTGAADRGRGTCTASCDLRPSRDLALTLDTGCASCAVTVALASTRDELNCYCCLQEYLRDDLPCGSAACASCSPTAPALAADASHYIIPDAPALADLLEVFELAEMAHYVLLSRRGPFPFPSSFHAAPKRPARVSLERKPPLRSSVAASVVCWQLTVSLCARQRAAALARLRQCAALGAVARALPGRAPLLRAAGRPALRADRRVRARCPKCMSLVLERANCMPSACRLCSSMPTARLLCCAGSK